MPSKVATASFGDLFVSIYRQGDFCGLPEEPEGLCRRNQEVTKGLLLLETIVRSNISRASFPSLACKESNNAAELTWAFCTLLV